MNTTYVRACPICKKERICKPEKLKDPNWDGLCHRCSGAKLLKEEFPIGILIGDWVVEGYTFNRHNQLVVRCSCGTTSTLSAATAKSVRSKRCTRCSYKKISEDKSCGNVHNSYYLQLKNAAARRNIKFAISMEDMWNQYQKQKGICSMTGLELTLTNSNNFHLQTASLDRIDSKQGYIKENIQWMHKDVNKMKMELPQERFLEIVKQISKYKQL